LFLLLRLVQVTGKSIAKVIAVEDAGESVFSFVYPSMVLVYATFTHQIFRVLLSFFVLVEPSILSAPSARSPLLDALRFTHKINPLGS